MEEDTAKRHREDNWETWRSTDLRKVKDMSLCQAQGKKGDGLRHESCEGEVIRIQVGQGIVKHGMIGQSIGKHIAHEDHVILIRERRTCEGGRGKGFPSPLMIQNVNHSALGQLALDMGAILLHEAFHFFPTLQIIGSCDVLL